MLDLRTLFELSQSADSEIDRRVWVKAYPFLNAIGWNFLNEESLESYFFQRVGENVGLSHYDC